MTTFIRREQDSLGAIAVSTDVLWGAHTQRALLHFQIGSELMPLPVVYAMARIKRAAAMANAELSLLDNRLALAIAQAAGEVLQGIHDQQFPLHLWQSGSGTQSHMNMNEVLANRASEMLGADCGDRRIVHPNDHVNLGQSSNDVFPTAMHLCVLDMLHAQLLPALQQLIEALQHKQQCYSKLVKLGRTHL
ncbi:MAG: lyase family protein, partial [Vogesella sp.]|uniref:lyase family protein n=1 Tax=Vogesella sp. TaxID=1904252 RepID=UPI003F35DD02